jgi:hypothetical protein
VERSTRVITLTLEKMRILYIASNPREENSLLLEREITELQSRFANTSSLEVKITFLPDLPVEELPFMINQHKPDILHISAHGTKDGLMLGDKEETGKLLKVSALKTFITGERIPRLVVLSACNSETLTEVLVENVDMAIGFSGEPSNKGSRESTRLLYERIMSGQSVSQAHLASNEMLRTIDGEVCELKLHKKSGIDPRAEFFFVSPQIVANSQTIKRRKNGDYSFDLGIIGCPANTHLVIFFTDDDSFINEDDEDSSYEDDLCHVILGTAIRGQVRADAKWWSSGDFRIYASVVTTDGEQFSASSTLVNALKNFHRLIVRDAEALPKSLLLAIEELEKNQGSFNVLPREAQKNTSDPKSTAVSKKKARDTSQKKVRARRTRT